MSLDLSKTATRLMKSIGDEAYVAIIRKSGGFFDPVAGKATGENISTLTVNGVVTRLGSRLVDGTRIKTGDKMILLDNEVTPLYTDLINFSGVDHVIVAIDEFNHAGTTQLWKVTCRG